MNPFSIELTSLMNDRDVKTYAIAQYCGIDRSNMYKILNGKRTPPSEEVVESMADYMRLKPHERKALIESYKVTLMGRSTFYRRKCVEEFLTSFHSNTLTILKNLYTQEYMHIQIDPEKLKSAKGILISGKQLGALAQGILSLETAKEHGHIKLVMQPQSNSMFEGLLLFGDHDRHLEIEHIFCLDNSDSIGQDNNDYNLDIISAIIPMFTQKNWDYRPYCYYDNITSKEDNFSLLSSMLITSEHALLFSKTGQYGILLDDANTIRQLTQKFDDLRADTRLFAQKFATLQEQIVGFSQISISSYGVDFQPEGCMVPFLTPETVQKYIAEDLATDADLLEMVEQYLATTGRHIQEGTSAFLFTESGIRSFLENGRISEIPYSLYRPIDRDDRLHMVKEMMNFVATGKYKLLRSSAPIDLSDLCLYIKSHDGYIMIPNEEKGRIYISVYEPAILNAFLDYFDHIDPKHIYTPEEGIALLQELLDTASA